MLGDCVDVAEVAFERVAGSDAARAGHTVEQVHRPHRRVDRMTRRGAPLNVFLLDDDPSLEAFVQEVARRNGGRVLRPSAERLGEYVVSDYLRRRMGGRGGRRSA